MLKKISVETALNTEFDNHLDYDWYEAPGRANYRSGYCSKILINDL